MIISKPKSTALTALGIFTIICLAVGGYAFRAILNEVGVWYHYLIAVVMFSIGFILLIRQVVSYKVVSIGDNLVKVNYSLRFKQKEFEIKDIIDWKEIIIKTKNDPYRQLEIKFEGYQLKLSVQENTNYGLINKYLKKRASKKMIK